MVTNLFVVGVSRPPAMVVAAFLPVSLVGVTIHMMNQRALRAELVPLRDEPRRCLEGLRAGGIA